MRIVSGIAFVGLSLAISGSALAAQGVGLCKSPSTNHSTHVTCQVVNGAVIASSCSCPAGYVLIDTGVKPAAGPIPKPASAG
jgi:hypothetical protein